ncbi:sensor domain-containing protein [Amycolatopsis sp. lyj-346]|uniref:sensor histidine kinase n=1 Tax=Amycolatopsis sp. lyj-346 TaxID=2789289 RepID=UPI00397E5345
MLAWLKQRATAHLRGLALAGLAVVELLLLLPVTLAVLCGAVPAVRSARRLPMLRRRLAGAWADVEIADPYLPEPTAPPARKDGLYRFGSRLYRFERQPMRLRRAQRMLRDPATWRDLAWLLLDPLIGGPLAALSTLAVGCGVFGVVAPLWAPEVWPGSVGLSATGSILLGVVAILFGATAGPWMLWVHALWTRALLGPSAHPGVDGRLLSAVWRRIQVLGAGLLLTGFALYGFVLAVAQAVALVVTVPIGLVPVYPAVVRAGRPFVNLCRELAGQVAGVKIVAPYRPRPPAPEPDDDGNYAYQRRLHSTRHLPSWFQTRRWILGDPATWRDLAWLAVNPLVAALLLAGPPALVIFAVLGVAVPSVAGGDSSGGLWRSLESGLPGGPAIISTPWLGIPLAALLALPAIWVAPHALRAAAGFSRLLLAPTKRSQLIERVERLAETRADASGVQAAELRRIERDLHDGAQARLVAMGIALRAIERKLGPGQPELVGMVADVRASSSAALAELRDLVRGIHPPVLAERGLGDAVRAVALDNPLAVDVTIDLPGRAEVPVEACVYFAVCEALTNAAKHAKASRIQVDLRHDGRKLRVVVADNGVGGADPSLGTGLRGIRRRLGIFDGELAVDSPRGGPTTLTMEVPCVLSSPRTSTS